MRVHDTLFCSSLVLTYSLANESPGMAYYLLLCSKRTICACACFIIPLSGTFATVSELQ